MCISDGFLIHEFEVEHRLYVFLVVRVVLMVMAEFVYFGIYKIFSFSNVKYFIAIFLCKELSLAVEQLECIPLSWVVAGGNNYAAGRFRHCHRQLRCRCSSHADVQHVVAHAHESSTDNVSNHFS